MEGTEKHHCKLGAPYCQGRAVLLIVAQREDLKLNFCIFDIGEIKLYDMWLVRRYLVATG
jgi:hypothetical protein